MKAANGTWTEVTFPGTLEGERIGEMRRRWVRFFARLASDMRYVDPWERKRR